MTTRHPTDATHPGTTTGRAAATLALVCAMLLGSGAARAAIVLHDWGLNVNGTTWCELGPCDTDAFTTPAVDPFAIPGLDAGAFDFGTGLGSLTFTIASGNPGAHHVGLFLDHEIDEPVNTFFNESGSVNGTPATGLAYEIDEPGLVFGDIFDHFLAGAPDGTNGVPAGLEDDVSMLLAWDFVLAADEFAQVRFDVSTLAPTQPGRFHLAHLDPDSGSTVFFSSTLDVRPAAAIPAPATWAMLALTGFLFARRRGSHGTAS